MLVRTFITGLLLAGTLSAGAAELSGSRIEAVTNKRALSKALWGIVVKDEQGRILYARNSNTLMTPASVRKLFTGATVFACYGVSGTLETAVSISGRRRGSELAGDLVVRGGGDPSLGGRWEYDSDRNARLRPIVEALRRLGIDRIRGDIVIDVSAFDDDLIRGSWKTDNIGNSWAAPVDAIAYNENVIGVAVVGRRPKSALVTLDPSFAKATVEKPCRQRRHVVGVIEDNVVRVGCSRNGSGRLSYLLAVDDPALFAGQAIRSFLSESGIESNGVRVTRERPSDARPLLTIPSPPVALLMSAMLEESANLYAEMLLKTLSLDTEPATYEASLRFERTFLETTVGIDGDDFAFDDGSGLSPENNVTPNAVMRLLDYIRKDPSRHRLFLDFMASPGEGTLRKRLEGLEGRVFAKTGTIDGVAGLAGWVVGEGGETRQFVIFVNHHTTRSRTAMDAIDEIVQVIADF